MKTILLIAIFAVVSAQAGFDEKVAASYAAKYEVCSKRLKKVDGYRLKAMGLQIKADKIHKEKLLNGGYLKALSKEKKRAWLMPLRKCKKIANNI